MIDPNEFEKRYQIFESLDAKNYPHTFQRFWSYKLRIENGEGHILDRENRKQTMQKLEDLLKIWEWNKPQDFDNYFQRLEKSIEKISSSYNTIRNFSILKFDQIPENDLKKIWIEFSKIKDQDNKSNFYGELVMTITKPLMFLWGQTPAFDTTIRTKMPLLKSQGLTNPRWDFRSWNRIMKELQNYLNSDSELNTIFKKKSQEKYETTKLVSYGHFLHLYYWTENRLDTRSKKENRQTINSEKQKEQAEYQHLVSILNNLRSTEKISGAERRKYEQKWRTQPSNRDLLILELKRKMDT